MTGLPTWHPPPKHLPTLAGSGHRFFVRFTVTGIARDLHPIPSALPGGKTGVCTFSCGLRLYYILFQDKVNLFYVKTKAVIAKPVRTLAVAIRIPHVQAKGERIATSLRSSQ